jgi:protein TonB
MNNSLLVRLRGNSQNSKEESWFSRVRDNARAFFDSRRVAMASGPSAFDLLDARPEPGTRQRQAASLLLHAGVLAILLLLGGRVVDRVNKPGGIFTDPGRFVFSPPPTHPTEKPGSGKGAGGNRDLLPPTAGNLANLSPIVLIKPHLPDNQPHALVVEPAIFDSNAPVPTQHVNDLGLPWMKDRNNSNGPNGSDSMGDKPGNSVGTSEDDEVGQSNQRGPYSPGMTSVKCLYCPDPEYTEEARKTKLQGTVTLRVLVGADGRAGRVKIIKGLGLGLDERAMDTVRQWRFEPARDAARHAIPEWVTVEATYRLF